MKFFDNLKTETEVIQKQVVEMKKIKFANAIKQMNRLFNKFDFTTKTPKGFLVGGRNIK